MRQPTVVAALVSLLACSPEDLAGVQTEHTGITELSHVIQVHFVEGSVRLAVTRELRNDTDGARGFSRLLNVPQGAIATSLELRRGGEVVPAPLSTQEQVAAQWELLTGPGDAPPVLLGKLEWMYDGELSLELFGLPPRETVTVTYDLLLAPTYEAGVVGFDFPLQTAGLQPRFERADALESVDGFVVRRQHFTQPVADLRWATSQLDTDRTLWRLEVDAAPVLEPAPTEPRVVFVIDASHSEGPDGIAAQLELVGPYLANTPDARVEVVVTRRFGERLFGRFVPAGDVPRLLKESASKFAPGNGSNLDDGAALAIRALSEVGGPARVVLFTDERLRGSFSTEATIETLAGAPRDTVLHVVSRSSETSGALRFQRIDGAPLAPLAASTGGIFVNAAGHQADDEAAVTLRELVRPVRVDDFKVEAEGMEPIVDDVLSEGSTLRLQGLEAKPPEFVTVTGKIWAREFRRVVAIDRSLAQRLPGLAVGERELRTQLSDDEVRSAAFLSQAVSPFTSYLAAPANAAPSTAGGFFGGTGGYGTSSRCGGCSVKTHCGLRMGRVMPDLTPLLRQLLQPGVAACESKLAEPAQGHVSVEATGDEVVDVKVTGASPAMSECLTEVAWAVRLPQEFTPWHRSWAVNLAAPQARVEVEPF